MHFLIKDKAVSPVFYAIARNLGPIVNIKTCRGYIQFSHFDGNGFHMFLETFIKRACGKSNAISRHQCWIDECNTEKKHENNSNVFS